VGGNLRFPPTSPPSDTWHLVVGEHGRSPHSRRLAAQFRRALDEGRAVTRA
jgi:hypothetical protein